MSLKSLKNARGGVSFLMKLQATGNLIEKETPAQVLFCQFCEILMNTFFTEHLVSAPSDKTQLPHSFYAVQFLMFFKILLLKIST